MNQFPGHITTIKSSGQMSIVTVRLSDLIAIQALVIDTPDTADYLKEKGQVDVLFKETEVIVALEEVNSLSIENRIVGSIEEIKEGTLLSRLVIRTAIGKVVALISTSCAQALGLEVKTTINVMVKLNEVILAPIS
ncbi:tobe domain protein [Echinicola strongylocentroti]|uniref:Tobe domain protein n=1 Tax=Echinicola strongylocentroti TaxID=1795355 RepID=A0A2Z4IM50_9BACT|nr:tobe domain protein [Echinicola strongylocentroti]AWW32191.1 tobe domain protein [Echinicola strongylocentroti]